MPIYEYRCAACGHQQEFLRKVSDAPMSVCPRCGKPALEKMVTAAGFQLKGSGWYATDFKNSGSKPPASTSTTTGTGDAKSAGDTKGAGEAKPAAGAKPASDSSSASTPPPPAPSK
jgi:putative FmdB family regulatory protein